ncbi:hypothetical protein PSFL111601_27845 [Pseudomonas floridensis]
MAALLVAKDHVYAYVGSGDLDGEQKEMMRGSEAVPRGAGEGR